MGTRRRKRGKFRIFRNRRRSGNGTAAKQKLYSMVNIPFIYAWKTGITDRPIMERCKEKSLETAGVWLPVAWVDIFFAYQLEQLILRKTKWARITILGRGGKEIRFIIPGILTAPLIWAIAIIKWTLIAGLIVGAIYYATHPPNH